MGLFKACCGWGSDKYDTEPYGYEAIRATNVPQNSPEVHRVTIKPIGLHDFEDAISVCPEPKALCDGRVHSLLEPNAFNPPLCSTKLVDDSKHWKQARIRRIQQQSDPNLSFHTGGTLSQSFWDDINNWKNTNKWKSEGAVDGKELPALQRGCHVDGLTVSDASSEFDTVTEIPSYPGIENKFKAALAHKKSIIVIECSSSPEVKLDAIPEQIAEPEILVEMPVATTDSESDGTEDLPYDTTTDDEMPEPPHKCCSQAVLQVENPVVVEKKDFPQHNKNVRFTVEPAIIRGHDEVENHYTVKMESSDRVSFSRK